VARAADAVDGRGARRGVGDHLVEKVSRLAVRAAVVVDTVEEVDARTRPEGGNAKEVKETGEERVREQVRRQRRERERENTGGNVEASGS